VIMDTFLFDEMNEETAKRKATVPPNKTILGYCKYEAISALIKEMRLGNVSKAVYWAVIIYRTDPGYLGRRLAIFAGEDLSVFDHQAYNVLANTALLIKNGLSTECNVWYAITVACLARKFFQEEIAGQLDAIYEGVCRAVNTGLKLEIPTYALDIHTRRGKMMSKDKRDARYTGAFDGRTNMIKEWSENGKLKESYDSEFQAPNKAEWHKGD